MVMLPVITDMANLAFFFGVAGIYAGVSAYKWNNQGWKIMSAPMATFGVFGVSYSVSVYMNPIMGLIAFGLFGTIVSYALFLIGHENQ